MKLINGIINSLVSTKQATFPFPQRGPERKGSRSFVQSTLLVSQRGLFLVIYFSQSTQTWIHFHKLQAAILGFAFVSLN